MKKALLILTIISSLAYSDEQEIELDDLKPVTFENSVDILMVEGEFDTAANLIKGYEKDNPYFYNYTTGKIAYEKGKKDEALKHFNKALAYDKNNIKLNIDVLKIYIENKSYKKEVEAKFKFLEAQRLTENEKTQLTELKELYNSIYRLKSKKWVEASFSYNDNRNFTTEKDSEVYTTETFAYLANKELENGTLRIQGIISDKFSFSSDGTEGVSLSTGAEYLNVYNNLNYGIPFYLEYDATNSNEIKVLSGLNYIKEISKEQMIISGVKVEFLNNDKYGGVDLGIYGNYGLNKFINYNLYGELSSSDYDENMYGEHKLEISLTADKMLLDKYFVYGKYTFEYIDGNYELAGEKRKDMINTLKIGYQQPIFKEDIKFGADYSYSYDDTNFEGYSCSKNLINTSIKWEF